MNIEQVRSYALSLYGVTEDQAFGDDIINFRLEGKIFVCLWLGGNGQDIKDSTPRFAVKLTPERNEELREKFSAVQPAWHWNKKHWSDIYYVLCATERITSKRMDQRIVSAHSVKTSQSNQTEIYTRII